MAAIGYVRRSKESAQGSVSLDDQAARIRAYCDEQGFTVAEILIDDGVSGGKRARFERIRVALRRHRAGVLVVYHLDRFARDLAGGLDTLDTFSKKGVELHVVGRGRIEAESASGFLSTSVELLMAEHYRKAVSEKTRDALARLRSQGRRYSNIVPYGYAATEDGLLRANRAEQEVIGVMAELRAAGLTYKSVAEALTGRGLLARSGKPFAASTVHRILSTIHDRPIVDRSAGARCGTTPISV